MVRYHLEPDAALYLRDPASTAVGIRIITEGAKLMTDLGLEAFTFKKLAEKAGCTEVTIYNYFPNKHRMLQYYFQTYWLWLGTHCRQEGKHLPDPWERIKGDIRALCGLWPSDAPSALIDARSLRELVLVEGSKSFLHRHVDEDNALRLFQPYKDLCGHLAAELKACDRACREPRTFATTLIEMAHSLEFSMQHMPALTELSSKKDVRKMADWLIRLTSGYLGR